MNKKTEVTESQTVSEASDAQDLVMNKEDHTLRNWILRVVVGTLAFICLSVVLVLLYAFFDHSVNNDKIFEVIGPAFNMVVGAFVGLLGGISLNARK